MLPPGPYAVGFRSSWEFDDSRTYRTEFDDGASYGGEESPRPVLVLQWYPTHDSGEAHMPHGQYFDIANGDPRLGGFAVALTDYARTMFAYYVMGKPEEELDPAERAEMAEALSEPTSCIKGAEPADGSFPLIVYHGGLGSSFEDNAALCAYLAGHGFAVLGSAFPEADGQSLNIDGFAGSAGDVGFLVDWARSTSYGDVERVGLIGHSAGAQAMLRIAGRNESPCNALVLLDTTQDYFSLAFPFFVPLVREVTDQTATLTAPMLVVTEPAAIFALCDRLVNAERTYLTVPGLGHNDFISQGQQRFARVARSPEVSPADADRAASAHDNYRVVCERVLQFFAATLRDDREASRALTETEPWDPETPCVAHLPRGTSSPSPYRIGAELPPTPRQFAQLLAVPGIEVACAALERARLAAPDSPICADTRLAGSLLYQLFDEGRDDDAKRYWGIVKTSSPDVIEWFLGEAEDEYNEAAPRFLDYAHRLEPDLKPGS